MFTVRVLPDAMRHRFADGRVLLYFCLADTRHLKPVGALTDLANRIGAECAYLAPVVVGFTQSPQSELAGAWLFPEAERDEKVNAILAIADRCLQETRLP